MVTPTLPESTSSIRKGLVNILLVDDEPRNLDVLECILSSAEYRLIRADSAQAALMALIDGEFAVIVLDIQMPGTNGIELAHLIKQRKRTQHIPIIFLTAYFHEDKEILQGYEVGAVDYLAKPVNPEILRSKIAVFVDLFRKTTELVKLNHAMEFEIAQRRTAEESLRHAKNELESRVKDRTAELTLAITQLSASEHRYRQLVSGLPAAVYTTDANGYVELFNEAAVVLWGRTPEIGKDRWCGSHRLYRPDGSPLPMDQCPMAVTLRKGTAVQGEEIILERPDGVRRMVLPYPEPIRDASGKLVGAVSMVLDITERRKGEEAARQLAAIVESSDDAIVSKDLNGIIATWNGGAERLFGYAANEVVGLPINILIPADRWDEEPRILERIRRGDRIEQYETVRRRKDGSCIEISLTVSPLRDVTGKVVGASKIARNITRQKRAERELERAHLEALAASRAKDEFLATLSHELRTPLNPVLLMASESAEDPTLAPEVRSQFSSIRNNVQLEARLIDDLLDMTHIRYGKLSLNLDLVDVHTLLMKALETVRSEIERKCLGLKLALDANRTLVKGDSVRLQQVFWNVLKNSVKFTPEDGRLTIATRVETATDELNIEISDTGIGMTGDELARVFEAFTQGDHGKGGTSRRYGGLGIGLALSKTLVESHSGNIVALSDGRDRGSKFIINLPLATETSCQQDLLRPATPGIAPAVPGKREGINILLVEDHEPTRNVLTHLLTRRHYQVKSAASIAEARVLSTQFEFQLLISDLGLPDGDGRELMREMLARNKGLQGIALTGYGMEQDIAHSRDAGFASHLVKPVRLDSLESALATAVAALGS